MTYDDMKLNDREILDVLALARREQAMVMVHAENAEAIAWLTDALEGAGLIELNTMPVRPPGRPEAIHRAIARRDPDTPVLVHVSAREAINEIRSAQDRGLEAFGETCRNICF